MGFLLMLFVVVPLAELWLLLKVGSVLGAGATFGVVLLTGVLGASLAKREGLRAMTRMTQATQNGALPTQAMFDAMAIFLGGALLLTPGFMTDLIGFALLVPLSRKWLRSQFVQWLQSRIASGKIVVSTQTGLGEDVFSRRRSSVHPDPRIYDQTLDDD